ncbi:hypothetical protein FOLKNPGA_03442 [Legionella sp. PC1000]|nr:hypothetical protein FOLKNPGA_03442 [Legionella sp. PC1000]
MKLILNKRVTLRDLKESSDVISFLTTARSIDMDQTCAAPTNREKPTKKRSSKMSQNHSSLG